MLNVAVLGSNGQLGSDLKKTLTKSGLQCRFLTREDIEAEKSDFIEKLGILQGADYVINCISYHKTDECEDFADKTFHINGAFVYELSKYCAANGITLFHISTDYVFDGTKNSPYSETDRPQGLSMYGISKISGEMAVQAHCQKYFILRVSSLFGEAGASGKGGNFVETMIKLAKNGTPLKVIADQMMAPTHTLDIARAIEAMISSKQTDYGIYNCCNSGSCSWYEFTKTIFDYAGIKADLSETTFAEYKTKAKRPKYSVLDNKKISKIYPMPHWQDALKEYLVLKGYIV
ncbi:MAG: dTDP-4-dehydrorhamnose reductase [Deferribacterales bacterium]